MKIKILELISLIYLLIVIQPINSDGNEDDESDTETVTDEVIQKIQTTQLISKKYVKEYNNLKSFKSKVSNFKSGHECVDACRVEVCEKSEGSPDQVQYCTKRICQERICSKVDAKKCEDAMTRKKDRSTVTMIGCINVCGCDAIESKFEEKVQRQKIKPLTDDSALTNQVDKMVSVVGLKDGDWESLVTHWISIQEEKSGKEIPSKDKTQLIELLRSMNSNNEWQYNRTSFSTEGRNNSMIFKSSHVPSDNQEPEVLSEQLKEVMKQELIETQMNGTSESENNSSNAELKKEDNPPELIESSGMVEKSPWAASDPNAPDVDSDNMNSDFALDEEYPPRPRTSRGRSRSMDTRIDPERKQSAKKKKSKASLLAVDMGSMKSSPIEETDDGYEDDDEKQDIRVIDDERKAKSIANTTPLSGGIMSPLQGMFGNQGSGVQEKSSSDGGSAAEVKSYEESPKSSSGGIFDYIPFSSYFSKPDPPVNASNRIYRMEPQTGPVDDGETNRQSMYADQNGRGRVPKHYFDDIRPRKSSQPTPGPKETTTITPGSSKKISHGKKDSAIEQQKKAMATEPKSKGAPDETIDMDYMDEDSEQSKKENDQKDEGDNSPEKEKESLLNQDEHKAETGSNEDEKKMVVKESVSKGDEFVMKDESVENIFTDAANESESFKIETSLPTPDMSELLLPEANSISSYSNIFEENEGDDELNDVLKTADDESEKILETTTETPSANVRDVTETESPTESTTEETPFVTGKIVQEETEGTTEKSETNSRASKQLKEIEDSIDDQGKISELDDPVDAVTEEVKVAAYYQGETTSSPENTSEKSADKRMELEMVRSPEAYNSAVESVGDNQNPQERVENSKEKEDDISNQDEQGADTLVKDDGKKVDIAESHGEEADEIVPSSNDSFVENVFTDSEDENESFKIDKSLPTADMSEILLPEANSLSSYSKSFETNDDDELKDIFDTVDSAPSAATTVVSQAKLNEVTEDGQLVGTTTEEIPFVTGEVEVDTSVPTEEPDEGTKTPEKDLMDIDKSLDDPMEKSELDDPINVQTETIAVAEYYQGETSTSSSDMESHSNDAYMKNSVNQQEKMELAGASGGNDAAVETKETDGGSNREETVKESSDDLFNQEEQKADTEIQSEEKKVDIEEASNKDDKDKEVEVNPNEMSIVESIFTDADNDTESFVIDLDLPVMDMSEILLPGANSLPSYAMDFETNGDEKLDDLLQVIDEPQELPSEVTESSQADLKTVTDEEKSDSTSTESEPFITGEVEVDTDVPTPEPEEKTITEDDLTDIVESLDHPDEKSDLDDPTEAQTEATGVAAYYQGETTTVADEDDEFWIGMDFDGSTDAPPTAEEPDQDEDYEWDLFEENPDEKAESTTKVPRVRATHEPQNPGTLQRDQPEYSKSGSHYSTPQIHTTRSPNKVDKKSHSQSGPPDGEQKSSNQDGQRDRRKTHMPSEDGEEESFWDEKPKPTKKSGSGRRKREGGDLNSPTVTAPPAEAPEADEGVVPDGDGGIFSNDSMISKPPKSITGTSDTGKLEDMFDDGIRSEDHKQEEQHDSDASSKKLDDESYGELGDGSKWYKSMNGSSKANSYATQEDKKDTEDVEATGEDSQGRTNNFKSKKNVRERRQKMGSKSSSHTSSTTKIMGGKNKKKNKEKKEKEAENGDKKPLVSEAEVTPTSTESSSEMTFDTSTAEVRRKRDTFESEIWDVKPSKSSASTITETTDYSYCNADAIISKYEAFKCQKDCYAKCSPAENDVDQCLDVCFLFKCFFEPPGDVRDGCESRCQSSCESESMLKDAKKGSKISKDECDDHVTQLIYFYGGYRDEIVAEYCTNTKSRRK